MNFSDLGHTVKTKGATLLGNVLTTAGTGLATGGVAGAAIGGVGSLIAGVAQLFNANLKNPDEIINNINADPDAAFKLKQLEAENEQKLYDLANTRIEQANEYFALSQNIAAQDTANARLMNTQGQTATQKWVDEFGKIAVLLVSAGVLFFCLSLLKNSLLTAVELTVVNTLIGGSFTILATIAAFYYGSSRSSQGKDQTIYELQKQK